MMVTALQMQLDNISGRLKAARASLNMSQGELAALMSLSLGALKKIESARNTPSGETLLKYVSVGFSPTWILTGDGPMLLSELRQLQNEGAPITSQTQQQTETQTPAAPVTEVVPADYSAASQEHLDQEILPRVVDAVSRAYRAEGISISVIDLVRIGSDYLRDVVHAFSRAHAPLTIDAIIPVAWLLTAWVQRDLRKPKAVQESTKREASGS